MPASMRLSMNVVSPKPARPTGTGSARRAASGTRGRTVIGSSVRIEVDVAVDMERPSFGTLDGLMPSALPPERSRGTGPSASRRPPPKTVRSRTKGSRPVLIAGTAPSHDNAERSLPAMAETAADLFVERLMDWGVDTVFGLPGDGINGFVEALRTHRDRMRYVHVRHEEVGAMAAVGYARLTGRLRACFPHPRPGGGYARLTGRLGVCFATAGPGAIHLANGLLDARLEGVPLLAITGMTYHDLIGTHYLQDYDTDYLFSNLAAYNQRIMSPEHIHNVLDLACRTALSNRVPVHIAFPIDYQSADAEDLMRYKRNVPGHTTTAYRAPVRTPPEEDLRRAAEVLRGRARPVILAGQGARGAREELERLAETLGAPIAKASLGKDAVPDDSPYVTGGIGVLGTRPTQEAMERCDALVIVGSSMPY